MRGLLSASRSEKPPVQYWIGVDGGGSRTRARLCDDCGQTLADGQAGPSALAQGVQQAWQQVQKAVAAAAASAGLPAPDWRHCALGLGLSGANLPGAAQCFLQAAPPCAVLALDSDAWIGLLGAHGDRPGALLIAGTGSVGMARDIQGQRRSVGGWGWANGDEGSGAWLGLAAVRHAQRVLDGRESHGPLASAVLRVTGDNSPALLAWQRTAGQTGHAALAPLVFEHEAADPKAARLLRQAQAELLLIAQALDPLAQLPVVLAGSVAQRLAPRLAPFLGGRCVPAKADALAGALQLVHAPVHKVTH
jgi:glucosamine kinase